MVARPPGSLLCGVVIGGRRWPGRVFVSRSENEEGRKEHGRDPSTRRMSIWSRLGRGSQHANSHLGLRQRRRQGHQEDAHGSGNSRRDTTETSHDRMQTTTTEHEVDLKPFNTKFLSSTLQLILQLRDDPKSQWTTEAKAGSPGFNFRARVMSRYRSASRCLGRKEPSQHSAGTQAHITNARRK